MAGAEALGHINCGGIPMAIGVQADMAVPALANFGSDKLKRTFLAPSIAGDIVACLGVSEAGVCLHLIVLISAVSQHLQ